ncbi:substrate-binding domain-containing protein [soil metagenome]
MTTTHRSLRRGARVFVAFSTVGLMSMAAGTPAVAATDTTEPAGDATATSESTPADSTPSCDESADRPLIYVLYKEGTQQYFIDQADGARAAAEELCADITVVNVEQSGDKAITEVQNAIAAGAAGIGITVPNQQIGPQVAQLAADAGIPLIATDDIIEDGDGNPVPFAGFNGTDMGTSVGTMAADLLNEAGWIDAGESVGMLSVEKQDLSVCNERTDAEKDVVENEGGLSADQIFPVASDATIDGSLNAASPVITAHPDVTHWIVTGCNDESVKGALQALAAAGIPAENIIGVGLGAYEACKDWQADEDTGFRGALYISGFDVGDAAVRALVAAIDGTPLPEETIAATTLVDPTNWEDSGLVCT